MTNPKLTATLPDGTTISRSTDRAYTHVVVYDCISQRTGKMYRAQVSWAGSIQKAQAVAATCRRDQQKYGTTGTVQIVPVDGPQALVEMLECRH